MDTLLSLATEELGSVQSSLRLNEESTWTWMRICNTSEESILRDRNKESLNYLPVHLGFRKEVTNMKTGHGTTVDAKLLKWEPGKSKSARVKTNSLVRKKRESLGEKKIGIIR